MKTRSLLPFALGVLSTSLLGAQSRPPNTAVASVPKTSGPDTAKARSAAAYGALPLSFEPNRGQADQRAGFIARGRGYTLFLAATEAVLALRNDKGRAALRVELAHANPSADVVGMEELPGKSNYLVGADPGKWHTNVPTFAKVRYKNIYRGIDVLYYGNQHELEHDFIVSAGADPGQIAMRLEGARSKRLDARGDLILSVDDGEVVLEKPSIYQDVAGGRREVSGGYVLRPTGEVAFTVGEYDRKQPLVIDPVVTYSTFIGGNGDDGFGANIAVDVAGSVYITGSTNSINFPTQGGVQPANNGGPKDVFVAKLNPSGSALVYSTYIGGSGNDEGFAIAVDVDGNAYVTGTTPGSPTAINFPTTAGALKSQTAAVYGSDAFVTKLSADGSTLVYSTLLGGTSTQPGSGDEVGYGIAVDPTGIAYVTGYTESANFPTTPFGFQWTQPATHSGFITGVNATGTGLFYSTYCGFDTYGIALGGSYVYVTGSIRNPAFALDAVVIKVDPNQEGSLVAGTQFGGSSDDVGKRIAVDTVGKVYVTGVTTSSNFPFTTGAFQTTLKGTQDAFVTKLDDAVDQVTGYQFILYSTYLGGNGSESGVGIAVGNSTNSPVVVTGTTNSTDFPTAGAFQATYGGGVWDGFIAELNPAGAGAADLIFSSFLGGSQADFATAVAVDLAGSIYVGGYSVSGASASNDFPTTAGAFQPIYGGAPSDAFVVKIAAPAPDLTIAKSHSGTFAQGQNGAVYTITVSNVGNGPTAGTVTVTETLPAGLTATAIAGTGWTCASPSGPCTRSDALAAGASYPAIDLTVDVAGNAPATVTNNVTVAGDGDANAANNSASDPTTILPPSTTTTVQSNLNPSNLGQAVIFTAAVTSAAGTPTGSVTFKDGTNPLGTVPLTNGTASLSTNVLSVGTHNITAQYQGTTNFQGSASPGLSQVVQTAAGALCVNPGGTGGCYSSVQSAVDAASSGGTITIAAGTYSTSCVANGANNTESELVAINKSLAIVGAGAGSTILSGGCRVVHIYSGTVTISGVTVTGATEPLGFGGGGVRNDSSNLTMIDSVIAGNRSFGGGGGFFSGGTSNFQNVIFEGNSAGGSGGAMRTVGVTTLTDVTIRNNHADNAGQCGGGICDSGAQLTLTRVTLNGNTAGSCCGAIGLGPGGLATLTDVTMTGNSSASGGALLANSGRTVVLNNVTIDGNSATAGGGGGGIFDGGATITLKNSIVSNNSGGDCQGTIVSGDYNLIKSTAGCTISGSATHDLIGQDPRLAPLASNGGLTQTMALCTGPSTPSPSCLGPSPALNTGNPATPGSGGNACAATDQRGVDRQTFSCDIGAYQAGSFGAVRQSQTISFDALPGKTVGDSDFTVSATASSGLTVSFTVGSSDNCTISGATVHLTGPGSCTVTAHQAGDVNYSPAPDVPRTFNIAPASQSQTITVTTAAPPSAALNSTFPVAATASSGLAVAITTSGGCAGSGSGSATITMTSSTLTCVVHYNQPGDASYSAASEVTSNTTAGLASQSITVTTAAPASAAVNSTFPVAATASSNLSVAIATTGGCSGSGSGSATITMTSSTTTCVVHYNQPGDASYSAASEVTSSTTAGLASQSITVTTAAPPSAAFNSTFPVAATASSGLGIAITTTGGCSGSGSGSATITMTSSTTTCVVHYNQPGDASYNAASEVTSTTTAGLASQSITVTTAAPASAAFNATFPVAATASSGLTVAITTTGGCSIASGTVTMTSGTTACVVHYNQAGNTNYSAATELTASVTALKASQTISFGALANRRLNQSPVTVSATASSGLPVTFTTTTPSRCTSGGTNGATITLLATGTCTVKADQSGDANYSAAPSATQSFTIGNKTDQTIAVGTAAPPSAPYRTSFAVAATATSGLTVAITTTGGCSIAGGTVTMTSGTTTCVVHFNQAGNSSYNAAPEVLQSVSAQKITQAITITTTPPASAPFNASFNVAAMASSGLGVAITTAGGCSGSGTGSASITMTSSTTACDVRYNQAGNGNYTAATELMSNVTATKANQTISFGGLANKKLNQSPVTVSATASSGLPVAFTTTTPSVCTSSGSNGATITLVATGTCTVKADQVGNGSYSSAASVSQSFTVRP